MLHLQRFVWVFIFGGITPHMQSQIRTAILPVAGRGTRLLPATKSVPKEMLPVYDRPLLQYAVDEARASGFKKLVLVTDKSKASIQHYFERDDDLRDALEDADKEEISRVLDRLDPTDDMDIVFVYQNEPLGLGHAILCARDAVKDDGPVAVMLPDDLILGATPAIGEMARAYDRGNGAHMLASQTVSRAEVSKYGICDCPDPAMGRQVPITGLVEKPSPDTAPSQVAVIGRYILSPDIFDALENTAPGTGGEIQLTDAIAAAIPDDGVTAFRITGERYDCGHADGLLAAAIAVQNQRQATRQPTAA